MLEKDVTQPSASPWSSPVVGIRKRDEAWRFWADYRRLDKIRKKDVHPLAWVNETLGCVHGIKYFSGIDLRSG